MTDDFFKITDAIDRAALHSTFLKGLIDRQPALVEAIKTGNFDVSEVEEEMPVARRLRLDRRAVALTVAIGDLSGLFDLTEVTRRLSAFADRALDIAIRTAIAERTPDAESKGFAALALGKQGSFELNYSSDIDPILIYDPDTLPRRGREEPEEAAVRIGRRVVELLQARDADGYVLRVDLRLRPSPEITPIVLPVDAAISYYESQALAWERAAFIRARAAAGDRALGQRFLDEISPFVWRRGLDFGAVREIRAMSHRIRDHYSAGQLFGPGYDLKRGRGGIREAEFFAQIHQLIHGGRDPSVRAPATRTALARLAEAGWINDADARALTKSYTLLRTIEHRVQMIDDRQTHQLPEGEALYHVARLHGVADADALIDLLRAPVGATGAIYDALDDDKGDGFSLVHDTLVDELLAAGFDDGATAAARIESWRSTRYPALRSPAAREALEAVLPVIMPALATAPDPGAALLRLDAMLARLSSAVNIFRLLEARPGLATQLAAILSHAPPLAEALGRSPQLLDGLIDASAFDDVGSVPDLAAAMRVGDDADYQARLDRARHVVNDCRFALGAQIVLGASDPLSVSRGYARVAEAAVAVLAQATVAEFAERHGHVPDSELVVLGYGRFGGGALTHASDLDLVYLFTGDFRSESDGIKPLGATLYYNRLAQRLTAALSVATAAGPLYDIDTRLRPSGNQGPLVVSVESFSQYQQREAWSWEHMALTRARVVFGSPAARHAVAVVIDRVLNSERPGRDVRADATSMRAEMATHKPPVGEFDAKLAPGGLVDLEFTVHVSQLANRQGFDPDLRVAIERLADAGLLPEMLIAAHDLLSRLLVTMRLVAPGPDRPSDATQSLIARALGLGDWAAVVAALADTRQEVTRTWQLIVEQTDE